MYHLTAFKFLCLPSFSEAKCNEYCSTYFFTTLNPHASALLIHNLLTNIQTITIPVTRRQCLSFRRLIPLCKHHFIYTDSIIMNKTFASCSFIITFIRMCEASLYLIALSSTFKKICFVLSKSATTCTSVNSFITSISN